MGRDLLSKAVGLGGAHGLTHSVKKENGWKNLGTYNRYQMEEFGRFVNKLRNTKGAHWEQHARQHACDARLSLKQFPSSRNDPIVSAGGRFQNGRYLQYVNLLEDGSLPGAGVVSDSGWRGNAREEDRPLAHLFVSILQRLGVETYTFAGSTGTLERV